MKRLLYLSFFVIAILFLPNKSAAQSNTLKIWASLESGSASTLDTIIAMDQSSAHPHSVYQLMSTDTCYIFEKTITINNDITIQGGNGLSDAMEGKRPPCIQPDVVNGTIPGQLFVFSKAGAVINLENLYLLGASVANSTNAGGGMALSFTGDNQKVHIDHVIMEQWGQFDINFSGQHFSLWASNNVFRNNVNSTSVYTGEGIRMRNDLGVTLVDTIQVWNNIYIATNAYAQCVPVGGYSKSVVFKHNTLVGFIKNPFFAMPVSNWDCSDNILYDVYVGGMANGEFPWWDNLVGGLSSVIDLSPMSKANAARFGIDTTKTNWSALAEAARTIKVNDNIYFKSPVIASAVDTWNTTHTGTDSIHIVPWMNHLTDSMFTNKTAWPGLTANGNLLDTDPQFGANINTMIGTAGTETDTVNFGMGLIHYLLAARGNGGVANGQYGFFQAKPDYNSGVWKPVWPLQEKTDLVYKASLTAPDGHKYGWDPTLENFVTDVKSRSIVAGTFKLSQNYPNPFNPTTNIQFSIPQSDNVSLKVYNLLGQEIATLVNGFKIAGSYSVDFNASNLPSGLYIYRLTAGSFTSTKKMMLLK